MDIFANAIVRLLVSMPCKIRIHFLPNVVMELTLRLLILEREGKISLCKKTVYVLYLGLYNDRYVSKKYRPCGSQGI